MPEAKTLFEFPARLMKRAPDETLLDLAKSRNAFDPSVFDEHRPFFFSAAISNGELDCYYTRMATSSLQNYAADADAGVSLQDSHWERRLGLGHSAGTILYEMTRDLELVKRFLRHTRIGTTSDIYVHPSETVAIEAVNGMTSVL